MGIPNASGGWGGIDRPGSQSGQGPSGITTGGGQTDAMPDVGPKENAKHIDHPQSDLPGGQWKKSEWATLDESDGGQGKESEPAIPDEPIMMYAILAFPQDKYGAWASSLPDFIKVMEIKIFDQDARDRLGL